LSKLSAHITKIFPRTSELRCWPEQKKTRHRGDVSSELLASQSQRANRRLQGEHDFLQKIHRSLKSHVRALPGSRQVSSWVIPKYPAMVVGSSIKAMLSLRSGA